MKRKNKPVKYPENLGLRSDLKETGLSIAQMAKRIECSRETLSLTVNGWYKGTNIVPRLKTEIARINLESNK